MLSIQRLNMDNTWWVNWGGTSLLLDPWLIGSEVDGFSWFNEQWHATPPVPLTELPYYQFIAVSQPYSDHCHAKTIALLSKDAKLLAVAPAKKRLVKELNNNHITEIPDLKNGFVSIGNLKIAKLSPNRLIDPIYHALIIAHGNELIIYAPHGFHLSNEQLKLLAGYSIKLLITSISYFYLPPPLGGIINPGLEGAKQLVNHLQPQHWVNTHDETKHAKGIVIKLAKRYYPKLDEIKEHNFIALADYQPIQL
jgi:L-ascorbate metabolism protein UlaG (beta-lactamase superfamily)